MIDEYGWPPSFWREMPWLEFREWRERLGRRRLAAQVSEINARNRREFEKQLGR